MQSKIKALSLFANVGVAEVYLKDVGVDVVVANELLEERAKFYSHVYPDCHMIQGDITDDSIYKEIISKSKAKNVEFVMATPPCQGMSLAGSKNPNDPRNYLIIYAINVIKELKPKYVLLENVTQQLNTKIMYNGQIMLIPEYIERELGSEYNINDEHVVDTKYYGVPQQRKRAIFLLTRKDQGFTWQLPEKDQHIVTLREAIGNLPSLDPEVREPEFRKHFPDFEKKKAEGLKVSKWHYPRPHVWRNVECMMHTPTGQSARKNEFYYPKKADGTMNGGAPRTYMRMDWDRPAPTITSYNHTISSFQNVHPGNYIPETGLYSDARVLTVFELMRVMSLPDDWNIPEWATESLVRTVIGEGVPPLAVMKIVGALGL